MNTFALTSWRGVKTPWKIYQIRAGGEKVWESFLQKLETEGFGVEAYQLMSEIVAMGSGMLPRESVISSLGNKSLGNRKSFRLATPNWEVLVYRSRKAKVVVVICADGRMAPFRTANCSQSSAILQKLTLKFG